MSSQEDINPDSSPDSPTGNKNSKDAMFEPKPKPKIIRVLTVMAYVLSVSMTAILLSIYYIFMWEGKPHIGSRKMEIPFGDVRTLDNPSFSSQYQSFENVSNYTILNATNGRTNRDADYTLLSNFTISENDTQEDYDFNNRTEMQQQFTAVESEDFQLAPATGTTQNTVTWFDDYDTKDSSMEDFKKSSILIRKLIDKKYQTSY